MFLPLAVQALYRSLEELAVCGQIPLELLPAIIHQYDLVLFTALSERGGGGVAEVVTLVTAETEAAETQVMLTCITCPFVSLFIVHMILYES